jgi:glucokinase
VSTAAGPSLRAGLDLGGTKIQAVVTGRSARVVGAARRNTPVRGGAEAVIDDLAGAVRDALTAAGAEPSQLRGVGIGAPGSIDPEAGVLFEAVNIDGWDEPFAVGPALADVLGVPVRLGNDVNVAVEAERRYGAGRGARSFLGVFWGTGVGGGIVLGGRLALGRGSAGEIGHICAKPGGRRCNCGLRGCVEAYAGRGALEERARREARKRTTVLFDLQRKRGRDKLTSGVWLRALDAGDAVAHDLLGEAVEALGVGIGSAVTLLDVERVVIGGGLGERLGPQWLKRIEKAARRHTFFREPPAYRLAELGDMGGAIGATLLVR